MCIDHVSEVYKVDTYIKSSTEFFHAKQYQFFLLTKHLVLNHNIKLEL